MNKYSTETKFTGKHIYPKQDRYGHSTTSKGLSALIKTAILGILFLLPKWIMLINRLKLLEDSLLIIKYVWSGLINGEICCSYV